MSRIINVAVIWSVWRIYAIASMDSIRSMTTVLVLVHLPFYKAVSNILSLFCYIEDVIRSNPKPSSSCNIF